MSGGFIVGPRKKYCRPLPLLKAINHSNKFSKLPIFWRSGTLQANCTIVPTPQLMPYPAYDFLFITLMQCGI
jgi:hypothetical protein